MNRPIPTQKQLEFLDWEFGVFFHFGIRSFFLGHRDWDNRPMPAEAFNPEQLDCRQWIRTAQQAGAKYAVLVCKHHDGFANWPTECSDYSVAKIPFRQGKCDVVAEFTAACREYGLKVGLYYSPAQWGGAVPFADGREYDDYFIRQIGELLTGYGKIDYLWFDSCGSEGHRYDRARIIAAIRGMQPDILIFNMWDPDTRWVGNEDGYAPMANENIVTSDDCSALADCPAGECRFLPAECDFRMRSTWFDCEDNEDTIKETDELVGIYEFSVGRGANFLINIGPDSRGLLPEKDAARLLEFGEELRRRYGTPVAGFGAPQAEDGNAFSIDKTEGCPVLVNRVVLSEDLTDGGNVTGFEVYARLPESTRTELCVYCGKTIGHKVICVFPTVRTAKLTVKVTSADGECRIIDMKAYYVR